MESSSSKSIAVIILCAGFVSVKDKALGEEVVKKAIEQADG